MLAACGASRTKDPSSARASPGSPSGPEASCSRDDDCEVTSTAGCCECAVTPFAGPKTEVAALRNRCAEIECAQPPHDCKPVPAVDDYHAECRTACIAVRNPAPPPVPTALSSTHACSRDDDCIVTNWGGCCSACPADAYATSYVSHDRSHQVCARIDCAAQASVSCPAVNEAADYRAVCRGGTCAALKR